MDGNFFNDLLEFWDELKILLKQDWEKFKTFLKEKKTYIFWILVSIITLQFTSILSLGKSVNCKIIQKGGTVEGTTTSTTTTTTTAEPEKKTGPEEGKKGEHAGTPEGKTGEGKTGGHLPGGHLPTSSGSLGAPTGEQEPEHVKSLLGRMKKSLKSTKKNLRNIDLGPLFRNPEIIVNAVTGSFYIIGFILAVIGIISLPALIILVIIWKVIEKLTTKITNY